MRHKWYALKVRCRFESLVATQLRGKQYEVFCPTYTSQRRWSDRKKEIETALFPGYIFCSLDFEKRMPILVTPGVLEVVATGRIPSPIEDSQIEAIRTVVESGASYQPHPYLRVGELVRIKEGSLCGVTGFIVQAKKNFRLVLSVDLLMRSVSVEVHETWVESTLQTPGVVAS